MSWQDASVTIRGASCATVVVNLRCHCGRMCRLREENREQNFYCRRHGLQGYLPTKAEEQWKEATK